MGFMANITNKTDMFSDTDIYKLVFDSTDDHVILVTDIDGTIRTCTSGTKHLFGYSKKELIGKNAFLLLTHGHDKKINASIEKPGTILKKEKAKTEQWLSRKDGTKFWAQRQITQLKSTKGQDYGLAWQFHDLTKRKLMEERIKISEIRYRTMIEQSPLSTQILAIDGTTLQVNKAWEDLWGVKFEQLRGYNMLQDKQLIKLGIMDYIKKGFNGASSFIPAVRYEPAKTLKSPTKVSYRWVQAFIYPVKDQDNRVKEVVLIHEDITKQKQAGEALRESEERFTLAQQAANIGTFDWKIHSGEFLCTHQLEIIYGLKPKGFAGKYENWLEATHPEDRARVKSELESVKAGKKLDSEFRIIRQDGDIRWVAIRAKGFNDDEGNQTRILGIIRNVTKRKIAEEALRESEEEFRSLADSMPQMVWTAKPDGYVDYYNKQWYEYTGFNRGGGEQSWRPILHPDDVDRCINNWYKSVKTGKPYQIEYRFKDRSKPGTYRWFLGRALPIKNTQGKIIKWFGTCTDIDDVKRTRKRKDELERVTKSLTMQRKQLLELNNAKDEFISIASHQLRTPATGVKQYIGMLLEGYAGPLVPEQEPFLRNAYESNERQINVVNDLLRVATVDAGKVVLHLEETDLMKLLKSILKEQAAKFASRSQKVTLNTKNKSMTAVVDPRKIRMVLENVIDNASKYTYEKKSVEVDVTKSPKFISIAVKDEGVGIGKPDQQKIFRKFTSIDNPLSAAVGGTGIGLYWAKKIIELHGGSIEVDSSLKKGSVFTVKIPANNPHKRGS